MPQLQHPMPNTGFRLMRRAALPGGLFDKGFAIV
jgi:hypothetical protein